MTTNDDITEDTPLLSSTSSSTRKAPSTTSSYSLEPGLDLPVKPRKSTFYIIALLIIFILSLGGGDEIIQPAQTRVIESIYCRRYYEKANPELVGDDGWVDEKYCKGSLVQGQVAQLKAWAVALDGVASKFAVLTHYTREGRAWDV
jgi:hypothetical protein